MKEVFTVLIVSIGMSLHSQPFEFEQFKDLYNGERIEIDSGMAKEYFDFEPSEFDSQIYTGRVLVIKPNFIILTCYITCGAGGICESSRANVFNYHGEIIDEIRPFEYCFADCQDHSETTCSYISDSLLILANESSTGDCMTDTIFRREIEIWNVHIDPKGRIKTDNPKIIDTRREHYYTSCYKLHDYRLEDKTKEDLAVMRNEIFASYGYKFKSKRWQDYFAQKYWYVPRYDDVTDKLNPIERNNIRIIQEREKE